MAKSGRWRLLPTAPFDTGEKHLTGRHNQKRHSWRYGKGDEASRIGAARRSMRGQKDPNERAEYRRRAGMPEAKKVDKAPAPQSQGIPAGVPVGNALKNGVKNNRLRADVDEAIAIINSVHGDGKLSQVPVSQNAKQHAVGEYVYSYMGGGSSINISTRGKTPMFNTIHEVGHFIDHQGTGQGWGISHADSHSSQKNARVREALGKVTKAIDGSRAVNNLRRLTSQPTIPVEVNGKTLAYQTDIRYIGYLLNGKEKWARAYSQYIVTKARNPRLSAEFETWRGRDSAIVYTETWDDDDFAPIMGAIDTLMEELGWRK